MTLRDDLEAYQTSATIGKAKQVSRKPKYESKAPLIVSFQQFHNLISSCYDLGVIPMRLPAPAGLFIPNMIALQIKCSGRYPDAAECHIVNSND